MSLANKRVVITTERLPCSCSSAFQDSIYGQGRRLHIVCTYSVGIPEKRCTVCSPNVLLKWPIPFPAAMALPPRYAFATKDEYGHTKVTVLN